MTEQIIDCMGAILVRDDEKPHYIIFRAVRGYEMFRIRDGGYIVLTKKDGTEITMQCRYGDDAHTVIDKCMYHNDCFAEMCENRHWTVRPAEGEEVFNEDTQQNYGLMQKGFAFYGCGTTWESALSDAVFWLDMENRSLKDLESQLKPKDEATDGDLCMVRVSRHTYELIENDGVKALKFYNEHENDIFKRC